MTAPRPNATPPVPIAGRCYIGLVVALALGLGAWCGHRQMIATPDARMFPLVPILVVLGVAAQHFPLTLAPQHKTNATVAVYFAALLAFGPTAGITLTAASQILGGVMLSLRRNRGTGLRMRGLAGIIFNAAQFALAVGAAGVVYNALSPHDMPGPTLSPPSLWALPLAAATLYLANSAAVAIMVAIHRGRTPIAVWCEGRWRATREATGLLLLGLIMSLLSRAEPWSPLLLVPLTILVQRSLCETLYALNARREADAALAHQASHDALTDLPNRRAFTTALDAALAEGEDGAALLFLDLDNFKSINDGFGHAAGDAALVAVARRLRAVLRPGEIAARFGGDEFTLLLRDVADADAALERAATVLDSIRTPLRVEGQMIVPTLSVGIVLGDVRQGAASLLRRADLTLHAAKRGGKAQALIYTPDLEAEAARRFAEVSDLRRAIAAGELRLHYQPLADTASGVVMGFEALVRWDHPTRGLIGPDAFVPLAEENGLIGELGRWVLNTACVQLHAWHRRYPGRTPLRISVNLSPRQLLDADLVASVSQALARSNIPARCLTLEITENVPLAGTVAVASALDALSALGIGLALDDFGTGFSGLRNLQRFPIDQIKVDRSFVGTIDHDIHAHEIIGATISLAHTLGLTVVAEGVETENQRRALALMGCDLIQGYLVAAPLALVEAEALFAAEMPAVATA